MELAIILALVAAGVWYFFFRNKEEVKEALAPAPYKVDAPVVEAAPVAEPVTEAAAPAPVAKEAPAKKPRAKKQAGPKTAKTEKAPAKSRAKKPKMTIAK